MEKNETNNVSKSSHFDFNKKRAQGFDKIHKTKKNFEFNKSASVSLCIKLMNHFHCFCYKGDAIESFIYSTCGYGSYTDFWSHEQT